jgi:tetratricopeptide (TPR) repeat protein
MNNHDPAALARLMGLMCEAIALRGAGQFAAALAALDQALALDPGFIPIHMQRAGLLEEGGDHAAAVAAYEACLEVAPDFADARAAHRLALENLVAQCDAALADAPGESLSDIEFKLAGALFKLQRLPQALARIDRALTAAPGHFPSLALRADILLRLNRHEEALAVYHGQPALSDEQRALAAFNRADILRQMGAVDEALAGYDEALRLHPGFAQAQVGRAHMLLMRGDYAQGWRQHEGRNDIAELAGRRLRSDSPSWRPGEDPGGKHLLLWAEQGLGDTLQFARYIGAAAARAARTTVCVPPGLLPLLAPSFPDCDFVVDDKSPPPHDLQLSLLSLPLLLDLPDPGRAPATPYLQADAQRAAAWRERLDARLGAAGHRPRIGIAWAGRQYATIHYSRDIPLAQLAPLFDLPADFISLQPEIPGGDAAARAALGERLHEVGLEDWADTAALMQTLDLVISVDTAVAHLAGALDLPALLMLRFEGEWRWGLNPGSNGWYPRTRLLRQQARGQWDGVVARAASAVAALIGRDGR